MGFSKLNNPNNGGGNYENPPAGTHLARCYYIVDQGMQVGQWKGKEKISHKIRIGWELPAELMSDGRPFAIFEQFTGSLAETAGLYKMYKSWFGVAPEIATFTPKVMLGKPAMVSIIHEEKPDGKVYANLSGVMPVPKGMPVPEPINEPVFFDFDVPDKSVFDKLHQKTQEILRKAQDWAECNAKMTGEDPPF